MNKILASILFLSFSNLAISQIKNLNEIEFNYPEFENNFNNYIEKGYPDSTIYSINIFVFNVYEKGIVNHITHAGN